MTENDDYGYPIDETDETDESLDAEAPATGEGGETGSAELDADELLAELNKAADGDGPLAALAKELLVARAEREEKARLAALVSEAEDATLGLSLYQRMDAGLVDPADVRLVLASQQEAEQDAYERRVLDSVRRKRIEEGASAEDVQAAVESRKLGLASMRAEYQAADPLDQDPGYRAHERAKVEAATERYEAEEGLRSRAGAWDGFEVVDGRMVSVSDQIAETLAAAAGER